VTDPRRIDVEAFAEAGATLQGQTPQAEFDRLLAAIHPESPPGPGDRVGWQARGERRPGRGGSTQTRMHLTAQGGIALVCQRCLGPVEVQVEVERDFLFVADEALAAELDVDSEDDVLASSRNFDLQALVEDELLLALPLVPRHEVCPHPLVLPADPVESQEERSNPFAALQALRRRGAN